MASIDEPRIEADPDISAGDSDSTLGDEVSKYTASLTSSIENYPFENGRRYHAFKDGSYIMPNDDSELDRLDLAHGMVRLAMNGKLFYAPIGDKPGRILDIGTGTGIWAIDVGDEYPDAEIIGTDISPTQPSWVPANVKFEIDDCEQAWTFEKPFDFVHARYMVATVIDWQNFVNQAFKFTKPGGWSEFQDFDSTYYSEDGTMGEERAVTKWITTLLKAIEDFGRDCRPGGKIEGYMRKAGYTGIVSQKYRIPIGPWPKDPHLKTIGSWNLVQIEEGLEAFTLRIYTQYLGWKADEVQILLANVRKDLRDPTMHAQFDLYVVYGQRPKGPESDEG